MPPGSHLALVRAVRGLLPVPPQVVQGDVGPAPGDQHLMPGSPYLLLGLPDLGGLVAALGLDESLLGTGEGPLGLGEHRPGLDDLVGQLRRVAVAARPCVVLPRPRHRGGRVGVEGHRHRVGVPVGVVGTHRLGVVVGPRCELDALLTVGRIAVHHLDVVIADVRHHELVAVRELAQAHIRAHTVRSPDRCTGRTGLSRWDEGGQSEDARDQYHEVWFHLHDRSSHFSRVGGLSKSTVGCVSLKAVKSACGSGNK